MKANFLKYFIAGFGMLLLIACEEQALPALTASQREMIDTIYLQKVAVLRPQLDSICEADFAVNVQKAVDSLIKIRKEEEARLRDRFLQPK